MQSIQRIFILAIGLYVLTGCSGGSEVETTLVQPDQPVTLTNDGDSSSKVAEQLQTELSKHPQSAALTIIMVPKSDLQQSINTLIAKGGKLIYDPNNRFGSSIPFFIADLTPELIGDTEFISSLNLKAATIDSNNTKITELDSPEVGMEARFYKNIPTESVKLSELGDVSNLGEGVTVAIIDSGTDASHPAFGGRVVYWYDATQETRTELKPVALAGDSIQVEHSGEVKKIVLPETVDKESDLYVAIMSEGKFLSQLDEKTKHEKGFLDLNQNNKDDSYLVLVSKKDDETKIYFDRNADLKLIGLDEEISKQDYNTTTKLSRDDGMVSFPSRNNIKKYPLLLEEEGNKLFIGLGKTDGMHGTHVAGIIAADDQKSNLLGAAPKANLMSIRACSGISCSDSAIIRGLYKAFYNGLVIPDVVNISLGSHEEYQRGVYSHLFNDLSAKFGTIFFVSASNAGPGFRTLNHFGNTGAVVMVGANVSAQTLKDQYNLPEGTEVQAENLLFFSSLGPSYTGEMKPNIVAPGAAISATPVADGYMSQANGTSMSSPLAAGAFASVLAKLKAQQPAQFNIFTEMRAYHQSMGTKAKTSLLPYVYAMRDALQNAAFEQAHLTRVQQGYGLMQAGKTFEILSTYITELQAGQRDYFEVVINDDKKSYDRSGKMKAKSKFVLSLGIDGERQKSNPNTATDRKEGAFSSIIANGVEVELDRVEILSSNGNVEVIKGEEAFKYFYISELGNSPGKLLSGHVDFTNSRTDAFYSQRVLGNMKKGKNYLAHYKIKYQGATINNIIDVVHNAYVLEETKVDVPSIDPALQKVKNGFAQKNISIKENAFHRYPILVTKDMNRVNVKVAIKAGMQGRIFIQLYNPEGVEVDFVVAQNTPVTTYGQGIINTPTYLNGKHLTGVWELTVSTASSTWLAATKYDLLVEAKKFGAKKMKQVVSAGKSLDIPIGLGTESISKVYLTNLKELIREKVKVKSSYLSYHPLPLEQGYKGKVIVNILEGHSSYWGNLSPKLYKKTSEGFELYDGKYMNKGNAFILKEPIAQTLYIMLDTIKNFSGEKLSSSVIDMLNVEILIDTDDKLDISFDVSEYASLDMAILKVDASKTGEMKKSYRGILNISSGDVTEMIDSNGNTIYRYSEGALVNRVELTINK
jgi:subtilisin family serine protease